MGNGYDDAYIIYSIIHYATLCITADENIGSILDGILDYFFLAINPFSLGTHFGINLFSVLYKYCDFWFVIQSASDEWLGNWPWNLRLSKIKVYFKKSYTILDYQSKNTASD